MLTFGARWKPFLWQTTTLFVGAVTARYDTSELVSPDPNIRTVLSTPNCCRLLNSEECSTTGTLSTPSRRGMLGSRSAVVGVDSKPVICDVRLDGSTMKM